MLVLARTVAAQPDLSIHLGAIELLKDTANQTVTIFIANTGDEDLWAGSANLKFQLDDGLGGDNAPLITDVDAVTGTPWEAAGGIQSVTTGEPEFWNVSLAIFTGATADLPANGVTLAATVTFDTSGLSSGAWDLKMTGLDEDPVDSKYNMALEDGGVEVFVPTVPSGQVVIIPEPGTAALLLLALAGLFPTARWRTTG